MSELSLDDLINEAEALEDQSAVVETKDFEYTPPAKGRTYGRLVEYIELGKQKQPDYQGKPKPPAEMVRITFELLGDKHKVEYEVDGEKMSRQNVISFNISKKLNTKAKFKKIFDLLDYGRGNKHIARFLGQAYILEVFHNEREKDGKKTVYANLYDDKGNWGIYAPRVNKNANDPAADPLWVDIPDSKIPAATRPIKLFLWERPTKPTWDSLFIDGTRTIKKGNEEVEVSNNWLQEYILGAVDFEGSPLDTLLSGLNLPITEKITESANENSTEEELPEDDDALAALGLAG